MVTPNEPPLKFHEYTEADEPAFRDFSCGNDGAWSERLNSHLVEDALDHAREGLNTTLVFFENKPDGVGIGYVALCCTSIDNVHAKSPDAGPLVEEADFDQIPAILVGLLAVREGYQDQGYGSIILDKVKEIALDLKIGCRFIVVDVQPDNKRAKKFYEDNRFRRPRKYRPYKWFYDVKKSAAIEEPPSE
jgi:GNAT superfamily N-acetyltransferase